MCIILNIIFFSLAYFIVILIFIALILIFDLHIDLYSVLAWEGYMEGVMKQASNAEYWDIWNRQKLGPDFELKQQQILKGDQVVLSTKMCIFI